MKFIADYNCDGAVFLMDSKFIKMPQCGVCGKEGEPGGYCTHTMEEMRAAFPDYLFRVPFK